MAVCSENAARISSGACGSVAMMSRSTLLAILISGRVSWRRGGVDDIWLKTQCALKREERMGFSLIRSKGARERRRGRIGETAARLVDCTDRPIVFLVLRTMFIFAPSLNRAK